MSKQVDSIVQNGHIKLEDVRDNHNGNDCRGRGSKTAAPRGYNAERLAEAVLTERAHFFSFTRKDEYDSYIVEREMYIECKSCVDRYPSGSYGRFRIWRKNHNSLYEKYERAGPGSCVYFFVVYRVHDGIEKEVGKLIVPVEVVDEIIDDWTERKHNSVGNQEARDISWNALLRELGISKERLEAENIINLVSD